MFSQLLSEAFGKFISHNYVKYPYCKKADMLSKHGTNLLVIGALWLLLSGASIIYNVVNGEDLFFMLYVRRYQSCFGIVVAFIGKGLVLFADKVAKKDLEDI